MNALEFSTKIEQGLIHLSKQFEEYDNTYVRIIYCISGNTSYAHFKKRAIIS